MPMHLVPFPSALVVVPILTFLYLSTSVCSRFSNSTSSLLMCFLSISLSLFNSSTTLDSWVKSSFSISLIFSLAAFWAFKTVDEKSFLWELGFETRGIRVLHSIFRLWPGWYSLTEIDWPVSSQGCQQWPFRHWIIDRVILEGFQLGSKNFKSLNCEVVFSKLLEIWACSQWRSWCESMTNDSIILEIPTGG